MMNLQEATMGDLPEKKGREANPRRPMIWIALAAVATIFMAGVLHGVIDVSIEKGKLFSTSSIIIILVFIGVIITLIYAQWYWMRVIRNGSEPLNARETLNRNIWLALGALGALAGAIMIVIIDPSKNKSLLDIFLYNVDPIPISVAIILSVLWSIITPIVTWFWYIRAIDEQEISAYKDGGNYAGHTYIFIVPTWWILWRAEILPEPNEFIIFNAFIIIWIIVWLWKKYL
jgi:hypothetical protein